MKNTTDCHVIAARGIRAEGGTFQNFVNTTFEENQIRVLWSRSLLREIQKIEFVGSGSSERVPVPGEKKGRVLLLRGRKQSGVSACSVGMAVARQSRLLAGSGRHDTANQIPIDLTLFFLAVPATELNHNSGKPTGVFLWDADGFLSILGHAIPHLNVLVTLRSLAFRSAISWPLQ